jgi:hypothetical protein
MTGKAEEHSEYIVFVDESGDHGLLNVDPNYPVFVLAFCIFEKRAYVDEICPALQRFKLKHWGHDMVVLHEHEIRKPAGDFLFLINAQRRAAFLADLNEFVESSPFVLVAAVIRKQDLKARYVTPSNPYSIGLAFGLERVFLQLKALGQSGRVTHIVVERRGAREDGELELEFRRICDGDNFLNCRFPFQIVMASKQTNTCGLQLADMIARPIGIKTLRPDQPNRAYEILERKFRRSPTGVIRGWGLKTFP